MSYSSEVLADSPLVFYRLGDSALVGTITATASSFVDSSNTAAKAFDGTATTQWTTSATSTGWLRAQLSSAVVLTHYAMAGRRDATPNRSPSAWTFEGSNDGSSWTTLDTQTSQTWASGEVKGYTFTNTTAYSYYRLNVSANTGDTYLNVPELILGDLVDSSGNGHHGSWNTGTQGATGLLTGDSDTAASFAAAGYCQTPYGSWMNNASAPFTVEAWIKTTATGYRDIVTRYDSNTERTFQLRTNTTTGALEFIKLKNGTVTSTGTVNIADGVKHHVVATYDGTNIKLYVDGTLDQTSAATGVLSTGTSSLRIGTIIVGGVASELFDGTVDEVALYNSALSSTRVSAHYTAGTSSGSAAGGTGALSLSGSGGVAASTVASGALALSGSGTVGATAGGSGALALSATGAVVGPVPAAGTGSLSLAAVGGASVITDGAGSLTLSGSGAVGTVSAAAGSGSITLSGTGTAVGPLAAAGSGALTLSGSGTLPLTAAGAGSLTFSAVGAALATFLTDLSNALTGRRRGGLGVVTYEPPFVAPPASLVLASKVDKARALPVPTLVSGRPT